jgi:hypothetical protein
MMRVNSFSTKTFLIISLLALGACGEEEPPAGGDAAADLGEEEEDAQALPDVSPDLGEPDQGEDVQEDPGAPDVPEEVEEDLSDLVEDAPEDMGADVVEDVAPVDMGDPDIGFGCTQDDQCAEGYQCIDEVCTLWPLGRVYAEINYVLERPNALTNVVSFIKGFFSEIGFFITEFREAQGDEIIVYYGGADRLQRVDEGPDRYRWQIPDALPSFRIHRLVDEAEPLQGHTWQSEVFDYRLVALFGGSELSFEAVQTTVTFRFNEALTEVEGGRIEGYLTRAEAERRALGIGGDCFRSLAICPMYDCQNDEPLLTVADVLDCNAVPLDSDVEPLVEGDDSYRVEIFFVSEEATLSEP